MRVYVIGKNGFLAKALQNNPKASEWNFISHRIFYQNPSVLNDADVVINCAFSPKLYKDTYIQAEDIDLAIAQSIKGKDIQYVMISSRAVYGDEDMCLEDTIPKPTTLYGQNKLTIEKNLNTVLQAHQLTILRCSNIFGAHSPQNTFFGTMAKSLKETGQITLNMNGKTQKDFLPIDIFTTYITTLVQKHASGVYNCAAGISIPCEDIAAAFIQGYGQGRCVISEERIVGQFFMGIEKLKSVLSLTPLTKDDILNATIKTASEIRHQ